MSDASFEAGEITEMDLALYAEGLLTPERCEQVERFLEQHPQFRAYCDSPDGSGEISTDLESPVHAVRGWPVEDSDLARMDAAESWFAERSVAPSLPDTGGSARWSAVTRPAAICLGLGLLVLLLGWRQNSLKAWDRGLQSGLVPVMLTDQQTAPHVVLQARRALEELQSGFWVSGDRLQARDYELAAVLVTQAALEMKHYSMADYATEGDSFPPLQLCQQARQLVDSLQQRRDLPELLTDLCRVEGEIEFQLGMAVRANRDRQRSVEWLRRSCLSFLEGIEQARIAADTERALEMSARLVKALHKGAAGDGVLTLEMQRWLQGGSAPELLEKIATVFPQQRPDLGVLRKQLEDSLSEGETVSLGYKEWAASLKMELCWSIIDQHQGESPEAILSLMDICNTIGIGFHAVQEPLQKVIPALHLGIAFGEKLPTGSRDSDDALLVLCRLHGNLADAYEHLGERDRAIESRERALSAARSLLMQSSDPEARHELGWLTGRQLISVFLQCVENDGNQAEVDRLLGSLLQISGDLNSMSGFQLARAEEELLRLIRDLRDGAVQTPPAFSETCDEFEMLQQLQKEADNPRLIQPYFDEQQDRVRILLTIPEFATSPQLQQLAQRIAEHNSAADSSQGSL